MKKAKLRGAKWVLGWSFRGQGSREDRAGDSFFHQALTLFEDRNPDVGHEQEKAIRLGERIARHRGLLVLDGLEPLQRPPGEAGGEITSANDALRQLIRYLAMQMNGLCVITTHFPVADLRDLVREGRASEICLGGLDLEDAVRLLKNRGLWGPAEEFNAAAQAYKTCTLSLSVLAGILERFYEGSIARWREVAGGSQIIAEILDRQMANLSSAQKGVMKIVGLFDGPAVAEAVQAVYDGDEIPGLTVSNIRPGEHGWQALLKTLRELHLLDGKNDQRPRDLDAHPEVRAYFANGLRRDEPAAWQEGQGRLYQHFKNKENLDDENPSAIDNLYLAIHHGCRAGHQAEVFEELVWKRMCDGFTFTRLNGHGASARDEMILKYFVCDPPHSEPGERDGRIFLWAALVVYIRGRVEHAVKFAELAQQSFGKIEDKAGLCFSRAYLSWFLAAAGNLDRALKLSESCLDVPIGELGDEPFRRFWKQIFLCLNASVLAYRGKFADALKLYKRAMREKSAAPPLGFDVILSVLQFHYACLLLERKYYEDAERVGRKLVRKSRRTPVLGFFGYQVLARIKLEKAWEQMMKRADGSWESDLLEAANYLDQGKEYLNLGPAHDEITVNALFMAKFSRLSGDLDGADCYLKTAEERVGRFALLNMDCCVERAWLYLAQGDTEQAGQKLKTVCDFVDSHGYHRIEGQLRELANELEKR
jgi:tetratricopeptide (TPR) repeat protein